MDRHSFYTLMQGSSTSDYEQYLNTDHLLKCQKPYDELCNNDELQFQITHQVQELWMKLIAYTLLEIDEQLEKKQSLKALTLFNRVHRIQQSMIDHLGLLETMSPKDYQLIRLNLGNGSGQESPGFHVIIKMAKPLWLSFQKHYLTQENTSINDIYNDKYQHDEPYMLAEQLAEFDELFQHFRYRHLQLIQRTIGFGAKSLKGRSVSLLEKGLSMRFFPELWEIRNQMTDDWGGQYGTTRHALCKEHEEPKSL
ncbi:tryptophan 2,3-dioxygenase family protein [Piscirickettsia litoralis]|uniref:Tryptophan 2,3-dioxygenase n=1 Tax=Piscirickettsia litoralis TaxID=1891921 RepID=A0ABX3A3B7_9GAMM|nr:tryptophan 2,3-dioxygenase family protein [Piscirickettsia litoralis]ODN42727.1 tryptophan 2,3-dioxygenase [Piscirickettsia litoralis]